MSEIVAEPLQHLDHNIAPLAHTPMYVWHKFWGRKTWNVVGDYINTYCPKGGIVFDPFSGSGVTALEALRNGRRAIVCDLNPVATEITRLTIKPVSETALQQAFERVALRVKSKILSLYETKCRKCDYSFPAPCFIWEKHECREVRYDGCPRCGDRREKNCVLMPFDKRLLKAIEARRINEWYPKSKLYYPSGAAFKERQQYESLDQLFTKRNLQALAWLREAIGKEPDKALQDFLKVAFTSIVHLCSEMCPISEAGHFTPFSSAWTQHSYWYPSGSHMEQNVWYKFHSSVFGHQGLLKAKTESNALFKDKKITTDFRRILRGEADVCIVAGDCLTLMKKMPASCIDYIFTDPPYDASIQYGELSFLWSEWLGDNSKYLDNLVAYEIVRNERQGKDFDVYYGLLQGSFAGMLRVLKPETYLTLTFHNPTFKVRNATIRAGVHTGFEFQKIHHQPLARSSPKSLLQPFGSAQGDFYMRFFRPIAPNGASSSSGFDETLFEKIVIDSTIRVLAERAEPTPYTIIINYIDPQLAKAGFFSSLSTGLDVKTVLHAHLDREFILVPSRMGGAEGKLWWFKDQNIVLRLKDVPLSERVEQTVLRRLQARGSVTFTDIWNAVNEAFPNSLTSDTTSIKQALEIYARPVAGGNWLLKPDFTKERVRSDHNEVLGILALVGAEHGYDIWIGKKEQGERTSGLLGSDKKLGDLATLRRLILDDIANLPTVEMIDLLWISGGKVVSAFEVESTTTMTSALWRGSNLRDDVPKFMAIPEEREAEFVRKAKSPLFAEYFKKSNWQLLYFQALRHAYTKHGKKLQLAKLANVPLRFKKLLAAEEQIALL